MKIIVCLDDNGGMMFNHRRQSRDRVLIEDMLGTVGQSRLLIVPYSEKLFADKGGRCTVSEDMLKVARTGDYCFVEDRGAAEHLDKVEELVIYRWNRVYPADVYFDIDLEREGFKLRDTYEFEGSSHEKITKEIFTR